MSHHVMAQPIHLADAVGGATEGEAGGSVALAEAVASRIPRLHPTAYAEGAMGSEERNRVWVALRQWLQKRPSWPSKALLNSTLDKLCSGMTADGKRLRGNVLVGLLCGQTAQEAVTTLAPLDIGEAAALLIYTAATADVKNCSSTGAATKKKACRSHGGRAI